MASRPTPYITPDEYLDAERKALDKSEYRDGQVFAMAGGRPRHHRIAMNTTGCLQNALADCPCQVFPADMRVYIPATGLYTYPDGSVVCGEPEFFDTDNLMNPIVLLEVLSKSTERYDRTAKFIDYQSIGSLKEYVMIYQQQHTIIHWTRVANTEWHVEIVGEEKGRLRFTSVGVELTFAQIYKGADPLPA